MFIISSIYNLFKTYCSFEWTNDVEVESENRTFFLKKFLSKWFSVLKRSRCNHLKVLDIIGWTKNCSEILQVFCNWWAYFISFSPFIHIWWNLGLVIYIIYQTHKEVITQNNIKTTLLNSIYESLFGYATSIAVD